MIKPIYPISLTIIALLILAGCGVLASGTQGEEAPAADVAPERVVDTETVVEVEDEAVAEESVPETVVEAAEPDMAGDEVMAAQDQAAGMNETTETSAVTETVEENTGETTASTEPEMVEAEAMPEEQPAEQPVADTAPSPEQQVLLDELTVLGRPPELNNEIWLNSEPLKLADLRGQVIIVEFWTFG